ncbi:MAG: hypothetical protein LBC99_03930 [Spirochaetota bacterium]|jgi:hypothetical protein|nr:hypothetical protein [Spirochaetota bacterium]
MGGRGASSGISAAKKKYGTEYRTIIEYDNIKFIQPRGKGSSSVPLETMSAAKDRVYAYVNNVGTLKSIAFYDGEGKRVRQIDLDHPHAGHMPHVHVGYDNKHTNEYIPLTAKDEAYIEKVKKIWNSIQ